MLFLGVDIEFRVPKSFKSARSTRPLVFHSINKSGSLSLIRTLINSHASNIYVAHNYDDIMIHLKNFRKSHRALVMGHDLYQGFKPREYELMTQVRNPVARVVSIWSWFHKKQSEGLLEEPLEDFSDFIRNTDKLFWYSMVAQFAVPFDLPRELRRQIAYKFDPNAAVASALHKLDRDFKFLTVAERFEESLFVVSSDRKCKKLKVWHQDQRNPKRPLLESLDKSELRVLKKNIEYDFELYDYGCRRLSEQSKWFQGTSHLALYKQACQKQYKEVIDCELMERE